MTAMHKPSDSSSERREFLFDRDTIGRPEEELAAVYERRRSTSERLDDRAAVERCDEAYEVARKSLAEVLSNPGLGPRGAERRARGSTPGSDGDRTEDGSAGELEHGDSMS